MLRGNYTARIDPKGRLKVPTEFRRLIDEKGRLRLSRKAALRSTLYDPAVVAGSTPLVSYAIEHRSRATVAFSRPTPEELFELFGPEVYAAWAALNGAMQHGNTAPLAVMYITVQGRMQRAHGLVSAACWMLWVGVVAPEASKRKPNCLARASLA